MTTWRIPNALSKRSRRHAKTWPRPSTPSRCVRLDQEKRDVVAARVEAADTVAATVARADDARRTREAVLGGVGDPRGPADAALRELVAVEDGRATRVRLDGDALQRFVTRQHVADEAAVRVREEVGHRDGAEARVHKVVAGRADEVVDRLREEVRREHLVVVRARVERVVRVVVTVVVGELVLDELAVRSGPPRASAAAMHSG